MDDLISRQAAIDAVKCGALSAAMVYGRTDAGSTALFETVKAIKALPSAQPEYYDYSDIEPLWKSFAEENDINLTSTAKQLKDAMWVGYRKGKQDAQPEWIPCSKTVDIPDHEILACDTYGEEMFGYLGYEDEQWMCASEECVMYDPIAWCEKPEPYKERREE